MEKLKKCHFNCGDTDLDKHTCQCYNDWLQENQERMEKETKHTPEEGVIPFLLGSGTLSGYWFHEDISPRFWWRGHLREYHATLQTELSEMKKEREELIGASQLIVDALVQSNIYMKELVGGVFGEHALNHYQQIISRIKK